MSGGAAAFLLPLLFQVGLGLSILVSGFLSGLFALGGLTMRALAPRILNRFGFRRTLIAGTLVSAAAFLGLGMVQSVTYTLIIPLVLLAGFAQALVFTGLNGIVFVDATEAEMGRATGLSAVSQQVGLTAGISLSALVLQMGGSAAPAAPPELSHFPAAFWATAAVLLIAAASLTALRKGEAAALRYRPEHALRQHDRI
jgi:MFS family permease